MQLLSKFAGAPLNQQCPTRLDVLNAVKHINQESYVFCIGDILHEPTDGFGRNRTVSNPGDQHLPDQINLASKLLIFQNSHFEIVMPGAATLGSSVIVI